MLVGRKAGNFCTEDVSPPPRRGIDCMFAACGAALRRGATFRANPVRSHNARWYSPAFLYRLLEYRAQRKKTDQASNSITLRTTLPAFMLANPSLICESLI